MSPSFRALQKKEESFNGVSVFIKIYNERNFPKTCRLSVCRCAQHIKHIGFTSPTGNETAVSTWSMQDTGRPSLLKGKGCTVTSFLTIVVIRRGLGP